MTLLFIILLILTGIALLILEILVVPGLIVGIMGGIAVLAGISMSFSIYGRSIGYSVAAGSLFAMALSIYLAFRYNVWKKFSLHQKSDAKIAGVSDFNIQPGDIGKSISAIRPMGTAMFNNQRIEVQTFGEMIETNSTIQVVEIAPNKILVKKVD
jgi:membrane-bound ClpP family serine protease